MIDNTNYEILNSYGGREKNSLLHVLNAEMNDEEEPVLFENSVYLSLDNVIDVLKTRQNALNVLSQTVKACLLNMISSVFI